VFSIGLAFFSGVRIPARSPNPGIRCDFGVFYVKNHPFEVKNRPFSLITDKTFVHSTRENANKNANKKGREHNAPGFVISGHA
jgi:hypothetical protein